MNPILLPGCTPVPLAHYLKALGILRLVGEQLPEARARGAWRNDVFVLEADLDEAALVRFFLEDYRPTPILAPWNGGSGFHPGDNRKAISALEASTDERRAPYRQAIAAARACVADLGLADKPDKDAKEMLLRACRNRLPEPALAWLDCAYVLTEGGAKFPPLLGTGGNDGRLEFTNNFMQRLTEVMDADGKPTKGSAGWLDSALFNRTTDKSAYGAPIGQFFPGGAGGFNSGPGFEGRAAVNPWDYLLMMEGATLFAAASVKRLGAAGDGTLVYPFCVRQAGVGYGSAAASDEAEARCEMWMPLWERPADLAELRALLGEGRAQVGGRAARNGVDFMRAAVSLGVDRGIGGFQRYGFQVRNGLAYFATPLDRVAVRRNAKVDLLAELEKGNWLERFRSKAASANPEPPGSVARALRRLEDAIFGLCRAEEPSRVQGVLVALGQCEKALARSVRWTRESAFLPPITGLSARWLHEARYVGSPEFRLAASLAATAGRFGKEWLPIRAHLEPVEGGAGEKTWFKYLAVDSNDVVWHEGDMADVLNAMVARRLVRAEQSGLDTLPGGTRVPVRLSDLARFIEGAGAFDDGLFADLLWGCSLIDYQPAFDPYESGLPDDEGFRPPALFALLRLAFAGRLEDGVRIPLQPAIHQRAAAGHARAASELAAPPPARLRPRAGHRPRAARSDNDQARRRRAAVPAGRRAARPAARVRHSPHRPLLRRLTPTAPTI